MMGFEKLYNSRAREASLADGAMFLNASLHGVQRKRGGGGVGGGRSPPIANTKSLSRAAPPPPFAHTMSLSRVLKGAMWVLFLLAG